ncbi:MAG: hypothetical protein E7563_02915 [Ruminococcaceae bacterium]|nr:hypothetical protein [Oscillospiraceae bacterium]
MKNNSSDFMRTASEKLRKSPEDIAQSAKAGDVDSLMENLSPEQQKKIKEILGNPDKTRQILENPQVQKLIRMFGSNG